jgi:hypothetical protein
MKTSLQKRKDSVVFVLASSARSVRKPLIPLNRTRREDRFSASLQNSLEDIGDDGMSPGKPNKARGAVAVLCGEPKDEK